MASMVDRGDSYHVIYLGSCMLTHMSTGLGVLQKPLRELYFKYRQAGGGPAAQERYLLMSDKGMSMTYKESASELPTEVFYSMPSILFWDAVQFCTVRGQDKKVRGAFEPIDNNHSRNKDNLFSVLEKKYHFLQQMTHPPLFTCVLRRTAGVKALDVHAFVCSSDEEALSLVRALHTVHSHYKSDESIETGVFGYRPFATGGGPAGADPAGPDVAGGPSTGWNPRPNSLDRPARPVRPMSMAVRGGGQVQVLPPEPSPHSHLSSHGLSSSQSSLSRHPDIPDMKGRPGVYQLTQQDFQQPIRNEDVGIRHQNERIRQQEGSPDDSDHHVYQYIRHIENSPSNTLERLAGGVDNSRPAVSPSAVAARIRQENLSRKLNSGSIEREPVIRPSALFGDNRGSNSIGRINQQRAGGPAVSRAHAFGRSYENIPPEVPSREGRGVAKLGQGYGVLSGGGSPLSGQSDHGRESGDRGSQLGRARSPAYESEALPRSSLPKHYRGQERGDEDFPPRPTVRPKVLSQSREDIRPRSAASNASNQGSPFDDRRGRDSPFGRSSPTKTPSKDTPDPPARPVAKVPPHKITGVKVLPTATSIPGLKPSVKSPNDRAKTYYDNNEFVSKGDNNEKSHGLPARRAKSQYFDDPQYADGSSSSDSSPNKTPQGSNWAFGRPNNMDSDNMSRDDKNQEDSTMNEKLLLSKKKDAEIASVLQDLRFDYEPTTLSPGLPAGNNFERSLGYFP